MRKLGRLESYSLPRVLQLHIVSKPRQTACTFLSPRDPVTKGTCSSLGINKTRTTPLHPELDGVVERYNRTLKTQLSLFVAEHQKDWDKYVPLLLMAYRTATNASTHFTPPPPPSHN